MNPPAMISDREFWMLIRSALVQVVRAIEKRYLADCKPVEIARIQPSPTLADGD